MGIVFALIGVVVIGAGVVILLRFTGRGTVDDVAHDRGLAAAPEGRIGAEDLRRTRFAVAFRGYRMDDVDALLSRLESQLQAEASPVPPLAVAQDPPDPTRSPEGSG